MKKITIPIILLLLAVFPFSFNHAQNTDFIADQYSEISVKLWAYQEFFGWDSLFGKRIDNVGYPNNLGMLNNPDIFASIFMGILRPILPEALCYNLMLCTIMFANLLSSYLLSYRWIRDAFAAILSAMIFAWSPVVLSYCIAGAITDVFHIWPYPLAIWLFLRGLEENPKYAIVAGLCFGLGFILCPYNFVIFTPIAIPLLGWLYFQRNSYEQIGQNLIFLIISAGILTGGYAYQILQITQASESMMSEELLAQTRHTWPFFGLHIKRPDRYITTFSDFFTYGKENVIIREAAARFYRAFSIPVSVLGLSIFALWRRYWLWGIIALFFILLSMGPFLAFSFEHYFDRQINVIWLGVYYLWPGTKMILEPFRYTLPAFLALGILSGIGLASLKRLWLKNVLIIVCATELLFSSTAPFPLAQTKVEIPEIYYHLDEHLPKGGIIEIPYYSFTTARFNRKHFLNQRAHKRPIPNLIPGFIPDIYKKNQLILKLLQLEAPYDIKNEKEKDMKAALEELKQLGFVGIILDKSEYKDPQDALRAQTILEQQLSAPIKYKNLRIYRIP